MDGFHLKYALRQALEEDSDSGYIDDLTSFQYLNDAATDFVDRTKCLKATQTVTTVEDTQVYDLNADFMRLYLRRPTDRKFYQKYNDGTSNSFITWTPDDEVIYEDSTTSVSYPGEFSIRENATLPTQLSSTTTSAGAASGGQCTLTDSAADFSDVSAGDWVHNTTDGSHGIVLSKTSSTALVTALFNGTNDDWSSADSYVIQPQGRWQIVLVPPPDTDGHTVTVYYLQRPAPVYSNYGLWRFPHQCCNAIVKYAAWLYKYREREPNTGDKWYVIYDQQVKRFANQYDNVFRRKNIHVSLKARR
jgi:hypothetical protein